MFSVINRCKLNVIHDRYIVDKSWTTNAIITSCTCTQQATKLKNKIQIKRCMTIQTCHELDVIVNIYRKNPNRNVTIVNVTLLGKYQ